MSRLLLKTLFFVAGTSLAIDVLFGTLFSRLAMGSAPREPHSSSGQTVEWVDHGTFYVTHHQHNVLLALAAWHFLSIGLFVIFGCVLSLARVQRSGT